MASSPHSYAADQSASAGFTLNVPPREVRDRLGRYTIGDLAVGDTGYVSSSVHPFCKDESGYLTLLPFHSIIGADEDFGEYDIRWMITIKPGRKADLRIKIGSKIDDHQRARKNAVANLAVLPLCRAAQDSYEHHYGDKTALIVVDSIEDKTSLSDLLLSVSNSE